MGEYDLRYSFWLNAEGALNKDMASEGSQK